MMKRKKQPGSLRSLLLIAVLLCWILPILCLMVFSGTLLKRSYERSARQELTTRAQSAVDQIVIRLDDLFEASRTVSYDGVVRNAYRLFLRDGDSAALYRTVTDYLNQNFTWNERIPAAFLSFWEDIDVRPYAASRGDFGYSTQKEYRETIEADVLEKMHDVDTNILLLEYNGELYIARNLLDSRFNPYATIVLLCDKELLFQSLLSVRPISVPVLHIDEDLMLDQEGMLRSVRSPSSPDARRESSGTSSPDTAGFSSDTVLSPDETGIRSGSNWLQFEGTAGGHQIVLSAAVPLFRFWEDNPQIRMAALFIVLLVLPLLLSVVFLFRRQVTRPIETLVDAYSRLKNGERDYTIQTKAISREFETLFENFNTMSRELKNQFERSILEQQALQQARVKALQMQINPHFLNNTLEIINWEARLAGDERVGAMIEALSVMMDGALGRDGRSQIHLREELEYVDAYLYIIHERLGERLQVVREIDEDILDLMVPRLILQPLTENAVEHDLSKQHGGNMCIRAKKDQDHILLEVEHDGVISPEDRASIDEMLASPVEDTGISGQIGLRNVRQRLKLLYGSEGELFLTQCAPQRILARVRFPVTD